MFYCNKVSRRCYYFLGRNNDIFLRRLSNLDDGWNDLESSLLANEAKLKALCSFLKVDFEPSFVKTLHDIVSDCKKLFDEAMLTLEYRKCSLDLPVPPIYVDVRSMEDISSVPLFDARDGFSNLTSYHLSMYHWKLTQHLKKVGFLQLKDEFDQPISVESDHWMFRVKELIVAPEDKMNRIDAVLEPSLPWKQLHRDIHDLGEQTPGLYFYLPPEGYQPWSPYITVADISNGMDGATKGERFLRALLRSIPFDKEDVSSRVQNISMGGAIPPNEENIDWNF